MKAYIQRLDQSEMSAGNRLLHSRLRDYVASLPKHRRAMPFCLEQLCDELDAAPAAMGTALRRCGFVRHERSYGKNARWEFWLHWSSPHQY